MCLKAGGPREEGQMGTIVGSKSAGLEDRVMTFQPIFMAFLCETFRIVPVSL